MSFKSIVTFKLSFILFLVESVERITLPAISIVPNVCVVPVPVIFTPEILPDEVIAPEPKVPVVDKFSSPNEIEPPESVIEPFVNAKLPALKRSVLLLKLLLKQHLVNLLLMYQ